MSDETGEDRPPDPAAEPYLSKGNVRTLHNGPRRQRVAEPPSGGDNVSMEERLRLLEVGFARIETKVDTMLERLRDMGNVRLQLVLGFLTIIVAVVATAIGIQQMTVSSFRAAADTTSSQPTQQPIIINVPSIQPSPAPTKSGE